MYQPVYRPAGRELIGPVHRHERIAAAHRCVDACAQHHLSVWAFEARKLAILYSGLCRIARMQRQAWFAHMAHQMGNAAGARHGVPLISHAAGVERERIIVLRHFRFDG